MTENRYPKIAFIFDSPKYYATRDGEIYSSVTNKILKPGIGTNGRLLVNIPTDGKYRTRYVHVLVCEAFHGRRPPGMTVSHIDGNQLNNRPENLKWETQAENLGRKKEHGTHDSGYQNSRAALSKDQVAKIKALRSYGYTMNKIAEYLGVSRTTISRVLSGERYADD